MRAIDKTYSNQSFDITQCLDCKLAFTNPRPSEANIGRYYDSPDYVSHTDAETGLVNRLYSIVKSFALKKKVLFFGRLNDDRIRTALDYGAGSGDFAAALTDRGWHVYAYEPNSLARERIKSKSGNIIIADSLDSLSNDSISVISLWHVLEHVHHIHSTLKELYRVLSDDGSLIIAVPNLVSYDARFYQSSWAAYDVPRHLYHFQKLSIIPLLRTHGFELSEIKGMWFDSFYVSLLSEQHMSSKGNLNPLRFIRAILIGIVSNFLAILDVSKCSSITYTFKKAR